MRLLERMMVPNAGTHWCFGRLCMVVVNTVNEYFTED